MAKVFISPSTQDWNSYKGGSNEEAEMRDLAHFVVAYLRAAGHTVKVGGTTSWSANVAQGNAFKPSAYIALHSNAGGGLGTEVLYHTSSSKGKTLATAIYKRLAPVTVSKDRGIKSSSGLGELNGPHAVSVIIECAFHDSLVDANDIKNHHKEYGRAIALGILDVIGGHIPAPKPAVKVVPKPVVKAPTKPAAKSKISIPSTIKKGSKSKNLVLSMQKRINADRKKHTAVWRTLCGWKVLVEDGDFGDSSVKGVKAFQRAHHMKPVTGNCSQAVWTELLK